MATGSDLLRSKRAPRGMETFTSSVVRSPPSDRQTNERKKLMSLRWMATLLVALVAAGPSFSAELYWSERDANSISRGLPDGSSSSVFLSGLDSPELLDVDDVDRYLYWAESGARIVARVSLAGGTPETLVENLGGVTSVAVDRAGGKVYWISAWGFIGRANLDGSGAETLVTGLDAARDVGFDIRGVFSDGFESGDTSIWSLTIP